MVPMNKRRDAREVGILVDTWLRTIATKCSVEARIKSWQELLELSEQKEKEATDEHVRVFNRGIAQIARLELTAAVTERMTR